MINNNQSVAQQKTTTNGIPNSDSIIFVANADLSDFVHLYTQNGMLVVESSKQIEGISFRQGTLDKYREEKGIA